MEDVVGSVELVTPTQAKLWLGNTRNQAKRDIRLTRAYANDMRLGRWKLNGEPITISRSGQLLSGRLRLQACVESEVGFSTLVVRGVNDEYFDSIDSLRRRTVSDILTIRREPNGRALGAALAILWRYEAGWFAKQNRKVSAQQLLAILEANPEVRTSLLLTKDRSAALPHGVAAAAHFLFSCVDETRARQFFLEFDADVAEEPANGAQKLRKSLEEMRDQGGARNQGYLLALTIKAWEAFRAGRTINTLRFNASEEFPKISGMPSNLALDGGAIPADSHASAEAPQLGDIRVESRLITPDMARKFLENNPGNRRISAPTVDRYRRDMVSGEWQLNGQTIKFGVSGRLLDGQHRLAACAESGVEFPALIVTGLDDAVFDTFDLGAKRSLADILIDRGEINTSTLAATLRQLWMLKNNLIQVRVASPSVAEMLELLDLEPGVRRSVSLQNRIREILAPSLACALHYLFSLKDQSLADEFLDRLGDGVALALGNPILTFREKLIRERSSKKRFMPDAEKAALMIKAWNALRAGTPVTLLRWGGSSGGRREEFPEIA